MNRPQCYIVTGGMGSGKTTLLKELYGQTSYGHIPEIADTIIQEQLVTSGNKLPWRSIAGFHSFQEELLARRIAAYQALSPTTTYFSDRSIPDALPFYQYAGIAIPRTIIQASHKYRYNARIFLLPPWEAIYQNTVVRPQSFTEAVNMWQLARDIYLELDYQVVDVPKVSIAERARFILEHLSTSD